MTSGLLTGRAARLPLLLLGAVALGVGTWSGLARLGAVTVGAGWPMEHGPLMVGGFLGTVIALERAVASRAAWALLGPAFCAVGAVALMVGHHLPGAVLLSLGSAVVTVVLLLLLPKDRALHHVVLALAGVVWLMGNLLLAAGRPVSAVVPFWLVFLVGTIAAERLELNRLLPNTRGTRAVFLVALALVVGGAGFTVVSPGAGLRALGAGALLLAGWLLKYDIARRTIRQAGQVRYIAAALLAGYVWLAVGGALMLWLGHPLAGPFYDAMLHAVLVGFVFSMIFGHALVILPAVAGVRVPFRPRFYAHLALLHLSLAARLAGDLFGNTALRQGAAWGNAAAIVLFLASTLLAVFGRPEPLRLPPATAAGG